MKLKFLPTLLLGASLIAGATASAQWVQVGINNLDTFTHSAISADYIETLGKDGNGGLYTAGRFMDQASGTYVAKWNGTSWDELGSGVNALAATNYILTICADPSGNIYAAGKFTNSSQIFAYVAKWNGTTWTELGAGQNMGATYVQSVRAITSDASGNIYAAGEITDNTATHYLVSKWDGTNWSLVGALNANQAINAMVVDGSNIYVAGTFTNGANSGLGNRYVAKWDGTSWTELGGLNALGANDDILSMAVDASHNVYVGGSFTDAASNHYIAKYNGTSWSELGGAAGIGAASQVGSMYALTTDASGNVYTSGGILDINGKEYVAKWNGTSWSHVGSLNADNFVNALVVIGNNIYAGGAFANATSEPYVARYDLTSTGIGELSSNAFRMYPNPASSSLNISFAKPISATVTVSDMTGQEIASYDMNNVSEKVIATNSFAAGMYIVKIAALSGDTRTMKLIKE